MLLEVEEADDDDDDDAAFDEVLLAVEPYDRAVESELLDVEEAEVDEELDTMAIKIRMVSHNILLNILVSETVST